MSIPTIDSGKIWEDRTTKEILLGITKAKKSDYAVLRIASQGLSIDGELLISKCSTIQGAKTIDPEVTGYTAVRILLSVEEGTYSLLDYKEEPEQAAHLEQGLKVRINQVINALPNLPDLAEQLSDSTATGRMRAIAPVELEPEVPETTTKSPYGAAQINQFTTAGEAEKKSLPVVLIAIGVVMVLALIATIAVITFKPPAPL
ncbi:MAG: hypothetical protein IPP57_13010 [Candidatus Obscuribacter sp.]|jgi:cobalamin biosynthesis Mg chelatase CobN|nr:hypothetical protein [Candidatus Obscuribacter sp.]MDQ5967632.1 hypothetical protein [Cyanobacteriota bacterium erpe_2018_sw_39hr_WHONDRS-SW48-000098_B_bin.30]MBK7839030.1 hypothetical protein [Candidatus Obscuribacter sp.]MBK9619459.1 hypothetical protein [Candidatus Obscuribacter sp.]MBK9771715.1 hypothetical protein [Candidatus Obscuribacter sp.]